jgi:hypothetical protein
LSAAIDPRAVRIKTSREAAIWIKIIMLDGRAAHGASGGRRRADPAEPTLALGANPCSNLKKNDQV